MSNRTGALAVLVCLPALGCGYHTVGHVTTLPQDVHTIAIPSFVNISHTYRLEQLLTASVVQEFVTRTHYRIENQAGKDADATLQGTVLMTSASPATYDSTTGRAASVLATVTIKVVLTDRKGRVLYQNPSYIFRDQYQVSRELSSFFEEDTPALERLSHDFARTLVSNILEGF